MNPAVEKYLKNAEEERQKARAEAEQRYKDRVLREANLLQENILEVEASAYYNTPKEKLAGTEKDEKGVLHYHIREFVPIQVTDEEFAEIEKTFPPETLKRIRDGGKGALKRENRKTSWAGDFCKAMAWIVWIVGFLSALISSISACNGNAADKSEAGLTIFFSVFIGSFVLGSLFMCLSEHFERLFNIENLLWNKL